MVTHALFRNLLIPLICVGYLVDNLKPLYRFGHYFILVSMPIILSLTIFDVNLLQVLIESTWKTLIPAFTYYIFYLISFQEAYRKTKNHAYSLIVSILGIASVGYLYEIPNWIRTQGITGLLRTSKNSMIILDWGMVALFIFLFVSYMGSVKIDRTVLFSLMVFVLWCLLPLNVFRLLTRTQRIFLLRIPAMFFIHIVMRKTRVTVI